VSTVGSSGSSRHAYARQAPAFVLIAGLSRSGSTVLGAVLGAAPDCTYVGETLQLWQRWDLARHRCSCGEPIQSCPFWSRAVAASRFAPGPSASDLPSPHAVAALLGAARRQAATGTIVESSKSPRYLRMVMREVGPETCAVVHVVRDPRGVLVSRLRGWKKSKDAAYRTPSLGEVARCGVSWQVTNLAALLLAVRCRRYHLVEYERFVERPHDVVAHVFADGRELPSPIVVGDSHVCAGNPARTAHGALALSVDDAWKRLPKTAQLVSLATTWPLRPVLRGLARRNARSVTRRRARSTDDDRARARDGAPADHAGAGARARG
jgi:hypothetical protein